MEVYGDGSIWKTVLWVGIGIVLVGGIIAACYWRVAVMGPRLERIRKELIEPYFELQARGEYKSAYDQLTTPEYRKRHSFEAVQQHHAEMRAKHGELRSHERISDNGPFSESRPQDIYQLQYRLVFEKSYENVIFEVVRRPEGYRLLATHTIPLSGNVIPEAW